MSAFRKFVSASAFQPSIKDLSNVEFVTDEEQVAREYRTAGEFEFEPREKVTDTYRKAKSINITLKYDDNGKPIQRAVVKFPDTTGNTIRCYGVKGNEFPERALTSEEIKKVKFGYCKSGGEIVRTRPILDMHDGTLKQFAEIYVDLRPLTQA